VVSRGGHDARWGAVVDRGTHLTTRPIAEREHGGCGRASPGGFSSCRIEITRQRPASMGCRLLTRLPRRSGWTVNPILAFAYPSLREGYEIPRRSLPQQALCSQVPETANGSAAISTPRRSPRGNNHRELIEHSSRTGRSESAAAYQQPRAHKSASPQTAVAHPLSATDKPGSSNVNRPLTLRFTELEYY
jgi:hypothetical protein